MNYLFVFAKELDIDLLICFSQYTQYGRGSLMSNEKTDHRVDLAPAWVNPEVSSLSIDGFRYTSSEFYEK